MKAVKMRRAVFAISSGFIILSLLVMVVAAFLSFDESGRARGYINFSSGWVDAEGQEVQLDKLSKSCVIQKEIPELDTDSILSFNARNVDVIVYIGKTLVYETPKTHEALLQALYGKTSGSDFAEIPVLREHSGETVRIDIRNPYSNGSVCKIVHMYLGDGLQIVKHDASIQLGSFCFSMIILFLGLVSLLLYIPMKRHDMTDRSMLYLGVMAFTFGMSMITDCKLLHVIVGHETLYYTISQMFMCLIPVPLLLFFSKLYGNLNHRVVLLLCLASLLDFGIILVLNCLGLCDYHDNAAATLLIFAAVILYVTIVTFKEVTQHGKENIFHNIGVLMIALAVLLDLLMTRSDVFMETSFFMRFGLAGFTLMECAQVLWRHIEKYQQGIKAQLVSRLAYHDGLTDMLNRTSFMEDIERLERDGQENVLLAMFDVNDLKYVNDNFGHADGDTLIINVANAIQGAFQTFGKCYRIGGDEFVFIAQIPDAEQKFLLALKKMMDELKKTSAHSRYPITVAAGYAVMDEQHPSLKAVMADADDRMYAEKKRMKAEMKLQSPT